jgi:hypothetical protein
MLTIGRQVPALEGDYWLRSPEYVEPMPNLGSCAPVLPLCPG